MEDSAQFAQGFLEGPHFLRQRHNILLLHQMALGTALGTDAVNHTNIGWITSNRWVYPFQRPPVGFSFLSFFFYLARETDRDAEDAVAPLLRSIALVGPGVGTCRILAKNGVSANPNGFLRLIARAPPLNPPPNAPHHFFNPNSIIFNSFGTPHSSILTRINVRVDHRPAPSPSGGASPLHSTIHLILGLEFFYLFSFFLSFFIFIFIFIFFFGSFSLNHRWEINWWNPNQRSRIFFSDVF